MCQGKYAVCSVQFVVCLLQCAEVCRGEQLAVCSLQFAVVCSLQCEACSLHTVCEICSSSSIVWEDALSKESVAGGYTSKHS